jgi:hypothetical protein
LASAFFPWNLFSRKPKRSFWFLRADTGASWQVPDPVEWSLFNVNQPILARASIGLRELTTSDGDRIIRLVTRRCGLNLIEQSPGRIIVSYWGKNGLADVRPFFKKHGLARNDLHVVLNDRKKEVVISHSGEDFLFGERLAADWPLDLYLTKWRLRFLSQSDDLTAAPFTRSGFAWAGIEPNRIPWIALKSAWRYGNAMSCWNCDWPTMLVNFGEPWTGLLQRSPMFVYICHKCHRSFRDDSVKDVAAWIATNLDPEVRPEFVMNWDRKATLG